MGECLGGVFWGIEEGWVRVDTAGHKETGEGGRGGEIWDAKRQCLRTTEHDF